MSATENHDGPQTMTVGIPTRARPPQPAPNRPVMTVTQGPGLETAAQLPLQETRRPSWRERLGGGAGGDGPLESDPLAPPRTKTSSASDDGELRRNATPKEFAKLLAFVVAGVAWVASLAASKRGWELREPDEDERAEMTEPIAAIVLRRTHVDWIDEDVLDGVRAAEAVGAYVKTRPLYRPEHDRAEMHPADDDLTPGAR